MAEIKTLNVDRADDSAFKSISEALGAAKGFFGLPVEIRIAAGVWRERLAIHQPNITLTGTGPSAADTVVTWSDGAYEILGDGSKRGTFRTATVIVEGKGFTARNLTIENAAGRGKDVGQAIALYVDADAVEIDNCRLLGSQDTLFAAPLPPAAIEKNGFTGPGEGKPRLPGTHLYKNCFISGDVDFIFGGARAFFDGCEIFSRTLHQSVNGYVAAPCTPEGQDVGFVFYRCRFTGDCEKGTVYLGRPWRDWAKVAVIECDLGDHIHREGFHDWSKPDAHGRFLFAEYGNRGAGAGRSDRAPFVKELTKEEALAYCGENFPGKDWRHA